MYNGVITRASRAITTWMTDGQKAVRCRRPHRVAEAVTGPSLLSWACREAQSHRTRPEEVQGPREGGGGGAFDYAAPRASRLPIGEDAAGVGGHMRRRHAAIVRLQ
jgi:hypothetical protein